MPLFTLAMFLCHINMWMLNILEFDDDYNHCLIFEYYCSQVLTNTLSLLEGQFSSYSSSLRTLIVCSIHTDSGRMLFHAVLTCCTVNASGGYVIFIYCTC